MTSLENYVGSLSPDGLVRVTPLEMFCGRTLTRWNGESDFIREFYLENLCGCSLIRWVSESDLNFVGALSPDGLVKVNPLENFMWVLSHQMG